MCRSPFKVIFQDQAVGGHLDGVIAVGCGDILDSGLEFNGDRAAIGELHDVVGLAHQRIRARRKWFTLAIGIFIYQCSFRQTQSPAALYNKMASLAASFIVEQEA